MQWCQARFDALVTEHRGKDTMQGRGEDDERS